MKRALLVVCLLGIAAVCGGVAQAQEKPAEAAKAQSSSRPEPAPIPLHVQLVLTELDGEKKVASMPFSFPVSAGDRRQWPETKIRNGVRVPVQSDKEKGFQYVDIGTNIDCSALTQEDGRFRLLLTVQHSQLMTDKSTASRDEALPANPTIRQIMMESGPVLRIGQTMEVSSTTDPFNGHTYKVTVTLSDGK